MKKLHDRINFVDPERKIGRAEFGKIVLHIANVDIKIQENLVDNKIIKQQPDYGPDIKYQALQYLNSINYASELVDEIAKNLMNIDKENWETLIKNLTSHAESSETYSGDSQILKSSNKSRLSIETDDDDSTKVSRNENQPCYKHVQSENLTPTETSVFGFQKSIACCSDNENQNENSPTEKTSQIYIHEPMPPTPEFDYEGDEHVEAEVLNEFRAKIATFSECLQTVESLAQGKNLTESVPSASEDETTDDEEFSENFAHDTNKMSVNFIESVSSKQSKINEM